jgi:alcohol dehydrogenase (cytochrome c)
MTPRALPFFLLACSLSAQVSFDRLLRAPEEPANWLTYSGNYRSHRYSGLEQITPANIKNLEMRWVFQTRTQEKFETTPLVVDGVMYLTQPPNDVFALDAATGRVFWTYNYRQEPGTRPCCGNVNRGLAIIGDTLFMGTVDARLIALDAKSGRVLWNVKVADQNTGYAITVAPLAVKDKVIIGTAGAEYGIRGFLAAYDAKTGKEAWRFYTVPGPGEPGNETWAGDSWKTGGGSIWVTGSYDSETNQTFWGIGNPGPDYNTDNRAGDNLYSDSVVALDADTGKLKWHFQFTPHDELDYDSVQVPVLADVEWLGKTRKAMLWANRNGFFYALDRTTGQFLHGKPFVKVTWASGLDDKGKPVRVPGMSPSTEGTLIYPGVQGGTNYYSPSYSPKTGLFYIPSWVDSPSNFTKFPITYQPGQRYTGGAPRPVGRGGPGRGGVQPQIFTPAEDDAYGAVRAIDPKTGDRKWEFKMSGVTTAGLLTTASNLLFTGGRDGYFFGLDARNGALLWKSTVGAATTAAPISYSVKGKQYVAVASGGSLFAFALHDEPR